MKDKLDEITEWWCLFLDSFMEYITSIGNATFELVLIIFSPIWIIPYYYIVYKPEQKVLQEQFKKSPAGMLQQFLHDLKETIDE